MSDRDRGLRRAEEGKQLTDEDMGELEQSASGRGSEGWKNPDLRRQRRAKRALQAEGKKGKEAGKHEAGMKNAMDL